MKPGLLMLLTVFISCLHLSHSAVPLNEFYPFGVEYGDSQAPRVDDGFAGPILLRHGFPFFNNTYNQLFVSTNGAVSFRRGITQFTPQCGALNAESTMIAPFWADIHIGRGGDIYYRESTEPSLLQMANLEIQRAFPNIWGLSLGHVFIATFDRVAYYGVCNGNENRITNTFQIVLTSDGSRSFAILNYGDIMWTTGTASGGNCNNGLGGSPAKAGFDVGDGFTFFEIPGTCTPSIVDIDETSNVGLSGKWIFRVDGNLMSAECDDSVGSMLVVSPSFVSVMGHSPISLKGPCLDEAEGVYCRFHDPRQSEVITSVGEISANRTSVTCSVPYYYSYGRMNVDLVVQTRDGADRVYSGYLYTTEPRPDFGITVTPVSQNWDIALSWDRNYFDTDELELTLIEFRDGVWVESRILIPSIANTGVLDVIRVRSVFISSFVSFVLRPIERSVSSKWAFSSLRCAESLVPYLDTALTCTEWYKSDQGPPRDVLICPPLLALALEDERFERDILLESELSYFHPGAEFAFRQRQPTPGSNTGQQCVYSNGQILIGPPGGGTADWTSPTYSLFDHWLNDVVPWCTCCEYSYDPSTCRYYYEKRPSDSGANYTSPRPAIGTGDPHFITLDGANYTFNAIGEFWFLQNDDRTFSVQTRMEQIGRSPASVFTAFVMSDFINTVQVQVSKNTAGYSVLLNGGVISFDDGDATLQIGSASISRTSSGITISYEVGFSFKYSVNGVSLSVIASVDGKFMGKVNGLLGHFDGEPGNDLQPPVGDWIDSSSNLREIHYNFGLKWLVQSDDSLFTYSEGKSYSDYYDPDFEPSFLLPDISQVPEDVLETCGESIQCLYDWTSTGDIEFAVRTKQLISEYEEKLHLVEESSQIIAEMCPPIPMVENGYYVANNFMTGSVASFYCNAPYILIGKDNITCDGGKWNSEYPVCTAELKCNDGPGQSSYHRDVLDCTMYYVCEGTRKHHMPCPAPLVFNEALSVCDWRVNVEGC